MISIARLREIAPKGGNWYLNRRKLCEENLYYLSRVILGRSLEPCTCEGLNVSIDDHEGVAVHVEGKPHTGTHCRITDLFVRKRVPSPEENWKDVFGELSPIKNRLLLYPRGTYKSSIDIDDVVQWVLCFNDIRVLFLPGDKGLGKEFLIGLNGYFTRRGVETPLEYLFPEHMVDEKDSYVDKYTTPARKDKGILQPTVSFSSLESSLGGHHYDVMKPDDAVTRDNSRNEEACETVKKNFYIDRPMLMSNGYCDGVGTIYADNDLWSDMIEKADAYEKRFGEKTLLVVREPAWTVKESAKDKKEEDLEEDDVILLFPRELPFNHLRKTLFDEPDTFSTQYMLRTRTKGVVKITEEMVRERTLPWHMLPQKYTAFIQWDLAYSAASGRDFTVGVIGHVDRNGKMYIIDIIRDRYSTGPEIAFEIVNSKRNHKPERTRIEDSMGAKWLESDMKTIALSMGIDASVEYVKVSNQKNAKEDRFRSVQVVLNSGRLFFSASISCYDEMMRELTKNTGKDDIRDAIALLLEMLPIDVPRKNEKEEEDEFNRVWEELRRRQGREMLYGGTPEPMLPELAGPQITEEPSGDTPNPGVRDYFSFGGSSN